jgi:hypothetical protein
MTSMMSSGVMGQGMMMGGQGMMNSQGMMMPGQSGVGMRLPDRLNWVEQHITAHMEMLRAIKDPATQLYAVLAEEQKRIADQFLDPMGMM